MHSLPAYAPHGVAQALGGQNLLLRMTGKRKVAKVRAEPVLSEDPVTAAMQACLKAIEEEIIRLSDLASGTEESDQQEHYWDCARQLQRDARTVRAEIRSRAPSRE